MVGIVVVSHSYQMAHSTIDFVKEMKTTDFELVICAGIDKGKKYGTNPILIKNAIEKADQGDGVLLICDLGSSVINTTLAISLLPATSQKNVLIVDAPFFEGLLVAMIANVPNKNLFALKKEIEEVRFQKKI